MVKVPSLLGEKYGLLTITADLGVRKEKSSRRFVEAKCECQAVKVISLNDLKTGKTRSCGCLNSKASRGRLTTHGLSQSAIYSVWLGIKKRCYDKKNKSFADYGGRGISMCAEWLNDFPSFNTWCINNGYKKGLEIDRINNNGNYEPGNCRFIQRVINARNKRSNIVLTYHQLSLTLSEWSIKTGIAYDSLRYRVRAKWPIEKIFTDKNFSHNA